MVLIATNLVDVVVVRWWWWWQWQRPNIFIASRKLVLVKKLIL
jgi:hypothetical protein